MIYRIKPDTENFILFNLTPAELRAKMGRDFTYNINRLPAPQPHWIKPDATFRQSSNFKGADKLPDISFWTTSHMVLNQKAYDALFNSLLPFGEFLPVNVEGFDYYIFNVLKLVDESAVNLDMSEREFEGKLKMQVGLHKLAFNEPVDALIFKTEYDTYLNIFCGDEFKNRVELTGLTGLLFKKDLASMF